MPGYLPQCALYIGTTLENPSNSKDSEITTQPSQAQVHKYFMIAEFTHKFTYVVFIYYTGQYSQLVSMEDLLILKSGTSMLAFHEELRSSSIN